MSYQNENPQQSYQQPPQLYQQPPQLYQQPQQTQQPHQYQSQQTYQQQYDPYSGYIPGSQYNQNPYIPTGNAPIFNTGQPKRRFRNFMKTAFTTISCIRSVLAIILIFMLLLVVGSMFAQPVYYNAPLSSSFSVIPIEGSIVGARSFGDYGYDHFTAMKYIKDLADNPNDRGILLYMNTPGGTVYHSEELRLALLEYKEITGRPVYVYMAEMCASGGYWISMAADRLMANRIAVTGSIGVVSTYFDTSQLFSNLGIRTVVINTGENKSVGTAGVEITPAQEAVIRSIIEEYQDMFIDVVASGRNMNAQTIRDLADGRIYTAQQAYDLNLIDEIAGWDAALEKFESYTGAPPFYPNLYSDTSFWGMFAKITSRIFPRTEAEIAISAIEELPRGVPLVILP